MASEIGNIVPFEPLQTAEQIIESGLIPLSPLTLRRMAAKGIVRAYKPGKNWLFRLSELYHDIVRRYSNGGKYGLDQVQAGSKKVAGRLERGWR